MLIHVELEHATCDQSNRRSNISNSLQFTIQIVTISPTWYVPHEPRYKRFQHEHFEFCWTYLTFANCVVLEIVNGRWLSRYFQLKQNMTLYFIGYQNNTLVVAAVPRLSAGGLKGTCVWVVISCIRGWSWIVHPMVTHWIWCVTSPTFCWPRYRTVFASTTKSTRKLT